MHKNSDYRPHVPAVEQACQVLLCLGAGDKFNKRLTEVYQQVGIHKSKAYTILNTLIKYNFVEKDAQTKTYSLGPGLILLSRYFLDNLNYMRVVSPFLDSLARETNTTVLFGIISGEYVYVVEKSEGNQNIDFTVRTGHRFNMTLGAHGKCIVAYLPKEKQEKILSRKKLYFYGDRGNLDIQRLRKELEDCRQKGYSSDIGEITSGISFISSPVFGLTEKIIGCVILIGNFSGETIEEFGNKTAGTAREISYRLGANLGNVGRELI